MQTDQQMQPFPHAKRPLGASDAIAQVSTELLRK